MKLTVVILGILMSMPAMANDTIKQDMKQIAGLFKQIATTMGDASKNQANAAAASQIAALFQNAAGQEPDSILKLPVGQQSAAVADYRNMVTQEANLASAMAKDFATNNNAAVGAVLQQMSDLKKEGHDKYNPQAL